MADGLVEKPFPKRLITNLVNEKKEKEEEKLNKVKKVIKNKKDKENNLFNKGKKIAQQNKSNMSSSMITTAPNDNVFSAGSCGGEGIVSSDNFEKAKKLVSKSLLSDDKSEIVITDEMLKNFSDSLLQLIKSNEKLYNNILTKSNELQNTIDNLNDDDINIDNNENNNKELITNLVKELESINKLYNNYYSIYENQIGQLKNSKKIIAINKDVKISVKELYKTFKSDTNNIKDGLLTIINNIKENVKLIQNNVIERQKFIENKLGLESPQININNDEKYNKRVEILQISGVTDKKQIEAYIAYRDELEKKYNKEVLISKLNDENIKNTLNYFWVNLKKKFSKISYQLVSVKPEGQGKGEFFIEFIFNDAKSLGGQQSYDISSPGRNFEVKSYLDKDSEIRLGTEGKMTRFEDYILLTNVYTNISKLLNLDSSKLGIFLGMSESAFTKLKSEGYTGGKDISKIETFLKNAFYTKPGSNVTYLDKLKSGEFCTTDVNAIQKIFNIFDIIVNAIYDNNYEYAKLLNNEEIYPVKNTDNGTPDIQLNENKKEVDIKCNYPSNIEDEKEVKILLGNIKISMDECLKGIDKNSNVDKEYLKKMIINISKKITNNFNKHTMIIINDIEKRVGNKLDKFNSKENKIDLHNMTTLDTDALLNEIKVDNDTVCVGLYNQFMATVISQSGFKILPLPDGNIDELIMSRIDKKYKVKEKKEKNKEKN